MKIEWNKVIYDDCMNEENGLPTLPDKSVDLCFTDFPYGENFKGKIGYENNPNKIYYNDNITFKDQIIWFEEIMRICNGIMFTMGWKNFYDWIEYKRPNYLPKFWYKPNAEGFRHIEVFLMYGKIKNIDKIIDVKVVNIIPDPRITIHSSPKNFNIYFYYLKKIRPESVIDPFLGSGTTAEVCTKLGIKWLGYELNEVYSHDINKRLKNCKKEPQQVSLEVFK